MAIAVFLLIAQVLCQSAAWAGPMMAPTIVAPGQSSGEGTRAAPSPQPGGAPTPADPARPIVSIGSGGEADAAGSGTPELRPEASPLDFKLSPDGTVATILFDRESVQAMRDLISQLEQTGALGKVRGIVYSAAGFTPMLILMGEKEELRQKLLLLKRFIPDQNQAHMIGISASLRELSDDDAMNVGLTLGPDIIGATISSSAGMLLQSSEPAQYSVSGSADLNAVSFAKIAQLNQALDRSKVLVSSEVYTRNGTKALLTNIQQVPIFSTDFNNNVMTSYQQLETSVDVIPTTIDYRKDKPEESQVRVDVLVKISVVTANHTYNASTTAPEYTTKTFATTRVLKANNARYVVGTFVNAAEYKEQLGLPLLSKIPIIKSLFSREGTRPVRNVAILTLAVRLIPMQVRDLTIDAEHVNPLEELYKRKGSLKDAK